MDKVKLIWTLKTQSPEYDCGKFIKRILCMLPIDEPVILDMKMQNFYGKLGGLSRPYEKLLYFHNYNIKRLTKINAKSLYMELLCLNGKFADFLEVWDDFNQPVEDCWSFLEITIDLVMNKIE